MQLQLDRARIGHHNIMIAKHCPSQKTNDESGMQHWQDAYMSEYQPTNSSLVTHRKLSRNQGK